MTYETESLSPTERRLAALDLALSTYEYDTETGTITRLRDNAVMDRVAPCGSILLSTKIRTVSAQQYVWFVMTGLDPNENGADVVHIDNVPDNNHWTNLERRLGSIVGRAANRNNSASPYSGVSLVKKTGLYRAQYTDLRDHKLKTVGSKFATAYEAKMALDEVVRQQVEAIKAAGFQTRIEA